MRTQTATRLLRSVPKMYDSIAPQFSRTRQSIWSDFLFFAPYLPSNPSVLDVGCGNGRLLRYYEKTPFSSYLGVDNSKKLLRHARAEHPGKKICFKYGDLLEMKVSRSYDAVFLMAVLHLSTFDR